MRRAPSGAGAWSHRSSRARALSRFGWIGLGTLALAIAGCPKTPRTPPIVLDDAGPEPDAPIIVPGDDTDGDGLCDTTEAALGLSPFTADSDDDGYSDTIEYATGSDGRMLDSPDRSTIVFLTEAPGARVDASITFTVNGDGETFAGSFADVHGLLTDPDLSSLDYFAGARAVGAAPPENVILVENERFVAVQNRTLLYFELSFENASLSEDCLRAFAFQYTVKDDAEGRIIGVRRGLLVVAPAGLVPGSANWCPLRDTCF